MTVSILLLGAGLLLIVAEVLFPSFGVLGVLAALAIASSVVLAFREGTSEGTWMLALTCVLVPSVILLGFRLLPRSPLAKTLMARGFSFEDGRAVDERDAALLGVEGVVEAPLRPAGVARLAGRRVDVVSRGEHVERGRLVRVVELKGNRVVVAPIEQPAADNEAREGA